VQLRVPFATRKIARLRIQSSSSRILGRLHMVFGGAAAACRQNIMARIERWSD
jgi:hypothetical protein